MHRIFLAGLMLSVMASVAMAEPQHSTPSKSDGPLLLTVAQMDEISAAGRFERYIMKFERYQHRGLKIIAKRRGSRVIVRIKLRGRTLFRRVLSRAAWRALGQPHIAKGATFRLSATRTSNRSTTQTATATSHTSDGTAVSRAVNSN